ncbi:NAD(P)-dependent dehydrogenase (short-subunit alcohol dehydrogenase family) [Streptomyces sp. SAI-144]|nr:NAD(P)-dependent dehydrogenase (short-subunit alcohol dehydrogenase family) [Streptomyces sp. SAI-144]
MRTRLPRIHSSYTESAMTVQDKRIIVTGSSRGIAAAAIASFARAGARVAALGISDEPGRALAEKITSEGPGTVSYFHADVSDKSGVTTAVAAAAGELGGVDALVNVAGIEMGAPAESISEEDWDRVFAVNAKGTFLTAQAVFPYLRENGGTVINFGSDAALIPYPNGAHYSASKGAVLSLTRTLAAEWGRYGIRVNSVDPVIWTGMYDGYRARMTEEELAAHDAEQARTIPLGGKLGDPDSDLAPVLNFLVSDGSRFITGQIISVNGGAVQVR